MGDGTFVSGPSSTDASGHNANVATVVRITADTSRHAASSSAASSATDSRSEPPRLACKSAASLPREEQRLSDKAAEVAVRLDLEHLVQAPL